MTRVLGIDWSGDKRSPARKRWIGEVRDGKLVDVRRGARTEPMADEIVRLAAEGPLVVGLDFAFGFPAWFARSLGARTIEDVWRAAEDDGESWLSGCSDPFWGRPGTKRPPNDPERPQLRRTERESPFRPKSVFQVGGAGAVGTGSIRGMPLLRMLSAAGLSIWPFADAGEAMVVEIFPRLLTKEVVKSDREARAAYLARDGRVPDALLETAASAEDPFDAAISALEMARHVEEIHALRAQPEYALEGAIWRPGWSVPA